MTLVFTTVTRHITITKDVSIKMKTIYKLRLINCIFKKKKIKFYK